jgi:hypothetical protein
LAELISWKWLYFQKYSICSCTPHQNSSDIPHRHWKINPNVHMEAQSTMNNQGNAEWKEHAGDITIPDFELYYRAIAIKTAKYRHKNKHEHKWNRIKDPDINPHSYSHLIFDKGVQNIPWRKDILFNKCCWENWISACRKLKLDPCLSPCTSIYSKWIKGLI